MHVAHSRQVPFCAHADPETIPLRTGRASPDDERILACLLIAEMVASRRKSLKNQLKDLFSRVGAVYNRRLNIKLDPAIAAKVKQKIASDVREFHGRHVREQNRVDGLKLLFDDGSWVLMRPSGTEPVIHILAEAETATEAEAACGTICALVTRELG